MAVFILCQEDEWCCENLFYQKHALDNFAKDPIN